MAPRCTSFQRGCLLILKWKSCSGSEILLIWSLSLMKYLCLSVISSSVWSGWLTPVPSDPQERLHQEGDLLGPRQTSCFRVALVLVVSRDWRVEVRGEDRKWKRNRSRRQTKTRKRNIETNYAYPANSSSEYIYHISHSVNSEVLYSDCLLKRRAIVYWPMYYCLFIPFPFTSQHT